MSMVSMMSTDNSYFPFSAALISAVSPPSFLRLTSAPAAAACRSFRTSARSVPLAVRTTELKAFFRDGQSGRDGPASAKIKWLADYRAKLERDFVLLDVAEGSPDAAADRAQRPVERRDLIVGRLRVHGGKAHPALGQRVLVQPARGEQLVRPEPQPEPKPELRSDLRPEPKPEPARRNGAPTLGRSVTWDWEKGRPDEED